MANAVAGVGTVFQRLNPNTDTWEDIAEINSIEGPNEDRDIIDVTSLDTEGGYDEFITGFLEGGTLVLNMNFNRNGYEVMKQDFEIDLVRNYRIILPDDEDTTLEFEGLVIEIPITMEAENQLTADVTIQVSGEVTVASAGAESSVDVSESVDVRTYMDVLTDGNTFGWYDAGDAESLTLNSVDKVELWEDQLGGGNNLVGPTESTSPDFVTDEIRFNDDSSSTERLVKSATLVQPEMLYLVVKVMDINPNDAIIDGYTSGTGRLSFIGTALYISASAPACGRSMAAYVGQYVIIRAKINHENSALRINAGAEATGDPGDNNMGGLYLGMVGGGGSGACNVYYKELIVRRVIDSEADDTLVYNYLATKYSIS